MSDKWTIIYIKGELKEITVTAKSLDEAMDIANTINIQDRSNLCLICQM